MKISIFKSELDGKFVCDVVIGNKHESWQSETLYGILQGIPEIIERMKAK